MVDGPGGRARAAWTRWRRDPRRGGHTASTPCAATCSSGSATARAPSRATGAPPSAPPAQTERHFLLLQAAKLSESM
jgi:hypothetical protein